MFVPRWLVLSLMVAVASVGGWLVHGLATNGFSLMPDASESAGANDAAPLNLNVDGGDPKPVINLTVNTPGSSSGQLVGRAGSQGRGGVSSAAMMSRSTGSGQNPVHLTVQAASPGAGGGYGAAGADESYVSNDSRITVNGNNIVVASDGSIVFQGDNGSLNGNTGHSSDGGTIAIDNNGSTISTGGASSGTSTGGPSGNTTGTTPEPDVAAGDESAPVVTAPPVVVPPASAANQTATFASSKAPTKQANAGSPTGARAAAPDAGLHAAGTTEAASAQPVAKIRSAVTEQAAAKVQPAGQLSAKATPAGGGLSGGAALLNIPGRSISISGYEDHSITVDGNDQIILYDDSNVFINRNGQVNANTGDTDSSGLNVVDATDSVVRSGNSGDGEGSGEDDEEEEDEDEAAAPIRAFSAMPSSTPKVKSKISPLSAGASLQASAALSAKSHGSVDDEDTATTADGDDVLVIGGDGYDDLAIRSTGNRNTVVYDDSNLVIGGVGGVNAQIGDSDTGERS